MGFITINYISKEFIFEEKRLNEISENKFSSKITRYTVFSVGFSYQLVSVLVFADTFNSSTWYLKFR